jgi:hypothetical protein
MPDTTRPIHRHPSDSSRDKPPGPGFDVILCLTTRHRWFTVVRLPGPHLAASSCDLFRDAHHDSLQLTQLTVVWDPRLHSDPGGPTPISNTALQPNDPGFYIRTSQSNSGHTVPAAQCSQVAGRCGSLGPGNRVVQVRVPCGSLTVESAWGAVPGLLPVRFPRPLTEPGVRLSTHRALRSVCRWGVHGVVAQGVGILLPR